MAKEENYEPRKVIGSWAGALGLGQFMPKSFRKLAVDFNGDGKRDLWNPVDAIGSVAHYFSNSGWKFNQPVATPINGDIDDEYIILAADNGSQFWAVGTNFTTIKNTTAVISMRWLFINLGNLLNSVTYSRNKRC